jgi:hypothetical protein
LFGLVIHALDPNIILWAKLKELTRQHWVKVIDIINMNSTMEHFLCSISYMVTFKQNIVKRIQNKELDLARSSATAPRGQMTNAVAS